MISTCKTIWKIKLPFELLLPWLQLHLIISTPVVMTYFGQDFSLAVSLGLFSQNFAFFFFSFFWLGFDMMAAHTVLEQRKQYPDMVLVAVVPYVGQDVYFNKEDKQRYADILRQADKVVVLSEYYYAQCYAHRNDYMISHACRLIAYWDGKSAGGTSYTFNKAQKKKLVIYNLF